MVLAHCPSIQEGGATVAGRVTKVRVGHAKLEDGILEHVAAALFILGDGREHVLEERLRVPSERRHRVDARGDIIGDGRAGHATMVVVGRVYKGYRRVDGCLAMLSGEASGIFQAPSLVGGPIDIAHGA